jgi:hypothetical protein
LSPYRCVDRDDRVRVMVGWVLIQALMWTVPIEMALVVAKNRTSVLLVVDEHPVGALGPGAADEPLGKRVRPRRAGWDLDHVNAFGGRTRRRRTW